MKTTHTPDTLTQASLSDIASFKGQPCLSLYQPTHRNHPDNQQDPMRFNQLVKELAASLQKQHAKDAVSVLVGPFEALAEDHDFWNHTLDGLAVLGAPGFFRVFLLQRAVPELAVVADSFHTKPLRNWLQSTGRYQVLALSLNKVQLFEGDRHALDAVVLAADVPQTVTEAKGYEQTEPHTTVSSYGGLGEGRVAMRHGHGARKDEIDGDAERFFRAVDATVQEHHSRPSGLPLMLAALPEHHHLFREVSHNPLLLAGGLMADPQGLTHDQLRQRSWEVMAPQLEAQQAAWCNAYAAAAAQGLGSENLPQIAHAAVAGRVASLLIEADRQVAGRIDETTGRIDHADLSNPRVDDVLDDLGALVESMGGVVRVLPTDRMPCRSGAAANFRH
ncbi:baeRF3 domain-containing protein [Rhodoferax antarcticus]|uniref:baeRF3 domain-containing protein n=1 Tax=Rhodoferax antarcticus TaxID=81479 RepID=UPI002224B53F|nr:hypothetical protein [Rhodoferax antarcticus]MCW2314012.1 hypothetical protein [Rhodoferax antarcticus]